MVLADTWIRRYPAVRGNSPPDAGEPMTEPEVHESQKPVNEVTEDRRRAPRAMVPPPAGRTAALFPHDPAAPRPPSRGRELLKEALGRRRNVIPLLLIVAFGAAGLGLLLHRPPASPAAASMDQWLTRIVIFSSAPATSLFANDHYLGEIGPEPREFTVAPGVVHLRVVRRDCQAGDSVFEFRRGERHEIGPLNPTCGTAVRTP